MINSNHYSTNRASLCSLQGSLFQMEFVFCDRWWQGHESAGNGCWMCTFYFLPRINLNFKTFLSSDYRVCWMHEWCLIFFLSAIVSVFLLKEIFNSVFTLWLLPALLVMKDQLLTFQRTYALLYAGNAFPKANRSSWVLNRELCSSKDTDRRKDVAALLMKNDVCHQLFSVIS